MLTTSTNENKVLFEFKEKYIDEKTKEIFRIPSFESFMLDFENTDYWMQKILNSF